MILVSKSLVPAALPRGARAAALALAALVGLATALPVQAQAQTETTFISNIGKSTDRSSAVRVTSFTTGVGPYLLSSVDLYSVDSSGTTPLVQIYKNDSADSQPGDWLATLTNPGSITDSAVNTFTDPANTPLESNTVYWLAVSNSAVSTGGGFNIRVHTNTAANSGAAAGWSIGTALWKGSILDPSWIPGETSRIQFAIRGYAGTTPPPPASTREVPADWALKPADIRAGGQFRLMFVSSTSLDATSTNIIDYNRVVRSRAGSAAEINSYARDFNALVSTESVNARENTLTRSADTEAPIYWVRSGAVDAGSRVVDDYAGLYAGTWSTGATGYSESGSSVDLNSNRFWTGTEVGGETDSSGFLGAANVRYWFFGTDDVIGSGTAASASTYRIAGLSPVFQVASSVPGKPTGLTATASGESQIDLSWTAPDDNGGTAIIGYKIEVSNHGTTWSDLVEDTGNTDTTYSHTGLSPSVIRYYRVSAINGIGASDDPSDRADATTGGTRVSDVLVSNTGQSDVAGLGLGANLYAQPFNTGDHTGGYHLAGVVLDFETVPSAAAGTITVTVREDSSGNPSGNVLYTLINPAFSVGSNEFLAPLSAELDEDRTYWVVASHAGSFLDGPNWFRTPISDGLDAGSVVGWTIDAPYKQVPRSSPFFWLPGGASTDAFQIAVKGSVQDSATIPPGAPQDFTAMQGDTRMTLSWAEPADAGSLVAAITKYQYRFSAGATVAGGAIWNDVPDSIDLGASTADETQVVVTGLSNGTLYAFEVRAVSSAGNGAAAGPRNATPRHVLATNVGQDPYSYWDVTDTGVALGFTTGSNANGYTLQSIELDFSRVPTGHAEATALTVSLWSATAGGEPNAAVATLINPLNLSVADEPGGLSEGVKAFRAPANTGLSADTKYFVHAVCNQCFRVDINTTESDVVDAGHDANWSIAGVVLFQSRDSWREAFTESLKIGINGTTGGGGAATTNNAPTAADNTVTTAQSARHTFTEGQFGFTDTDTGATLASVRIVDLPAAGTLALGGTAAVAGQIVSRADIVGGKLIFRPVPGAAGDPYATFTFKVNDGTVDSAAANTMTINVTVAPGATVPGAPTGLTATAAGQSRIDLDWKPPDDDGGTNITGYRIEISPDGASASWSDLVAHTQGTIIRSSYSHTELDAATTRHYRVSAINAVGPSDPSNSDHATTEEAITVTGQTEIVPADWALKPADIAAGEQFRLMFISSTKQNAFPADIADYNTFVSTLAAAGVTAMQTYAGDFTALVSTQTVNARENTLTRDTDTDVPIYWVRSGPVAATNRAADDYAGFYDGTWSTNNNGYNESGDFVGLTGSQFWTGTNPDGTTHTTGFMASRTVAIRWRVQSNGAISTSTSDLSITHRIVALSPVFQVAAANNPPTAADNTVTIGADAAYTLKAADFGFADTDTGDTLASVRIETLPALGELALDGAAAVVDQVVTRADIDDNKLTFTPAPGATGDAYTSFMFKVNDGTDFSAAANSITFNVSVEQAQTDIWSATLTADKQGYCDTAAGTPCADESYGALSDNDFILDGTTYTVESIRWGSSYVHLTLDRDFPAASLANLTLQVGSDSFALSAATRGNNMANIDNNYRWADPPAAFGDLEGNTVTVKLVSGSTATTEANTVTAQTDTTFISNSAQVGSISSITVRATAFTTGGNSGGYELSSVDIYVGAIGTVSTITPRVEIFEDNAGNPGTLHATLINPATVIEDSANTFNAPPNTTLSAGTIYWLVISNSAATNGQGFRIRTSRDATADTGAAAGWSIGNARNKNDITNPWGSSSLRIIFTIKGTAAGAATNTAPTGADNTVTTVQDGEYTFEADDFGFADTDTGDTLASVRIESVPLAGELKLDGTAAVVDQVVTSADIDADKLTFTPAPGASGDAYTSFMFKVNDGTDFSAAANTITFNLRDLSCAAPGFGARRNHWSGTVTMGVDESGGVIFGYGFDSVTGVGSFTPRFFTIGSNRYTIYSVTVGADTDTDGVLSLYLTNSSLTSAEAAALKLHVCDSAGFDFAGPDVEHKDADFLYSWDAALDWSPPVATRTLYLSLPANNPATGEPTISGTAQVGQDLTADVSGIDDDDGLPNVFDYQWFWVDADGASNETEISGETAATYTLTTADVGKKVKLQVSFTDNLGGEEMLTGAAFPAGATVQLPPTPVLAQTGTNEVEIWSATVTVHQDEELLCGYSENFIGFCDTEYASDGLGGDLGSLEPQTFVYGGNTFKIAQFSYTFLYWVPRIVLGTGSYIFYVGSQPYRFERPTNTAGIEPRQGFPGY